MLHEGSSGYERYASFFLYMIQPFRKFVQRRFGKGKKKNKISNQE